MMRQCVFIILLALFIAVSVHADSVRCPVCHQIFEDTQHYCPNDGTNLKVSGEVVDEDAGDHTGAHDDKNSDNRDGGASGGSDNGDVQDEPVNEEASGENTVAPAGKRRKYRRNARGTHRKSTTDEAESGARTDRLRRIGDERAGGRQNHGLQNDQMTREEFLALDKELKSRYLADREYVRTSAYNDSVASDEAQLRRRRLRQLRLQNTGMPFVSFGARLSFMGYDDTPGPVVGSEVQMNFADRFFRTGISTFAGVRQAEGKNDVLLMESLEIGIHRPWRFAPYLVVRFGVGALFSHSFGEPQSYLVPSVGIEAGVDARVSTGLACGVSMGAVRYTTDGVSWNSATLKMHVGF